MRPATKTESTTMMRMPYKPEPTPPKTTSPIMRLMSTIMPPRGVSESCMVLTAPQLGGMMVLINHHAAQRGERVVHGVDRAATGGGGDGGEQRGLGYAETYLLALHVAGRRSGATGLRGTVNEQMRMRLSPVDRGESGGKQDEHGRQHGPAMARRAGEPAQSISEPGRNHKDQEHLEQVRERRGVLEGVGAVGVEESAAIRAQHLDDFLRSHGSLRNGLRLG